MASDFPGKGKVAVLKTNPESVLTDIGEVMQLAGYQEALPKDLATILKLDLSWQTWFPAASSNPWQIEGVIRQLQSDGYQQLIAGQNNSTMVDAYTGERNNKHKYVVDKYGLENVHLYEPHVEWVVYEPKAEMLVLHDIYPEGIQIPRMFMGKNIIHLPTVKTHVFTTISGAMGNAAGGLLRHRHDWTHGVLHEVFVDLLAIQREIHPGIFAVMDGTFAGDGTGPHTMRVHEKDILLAGADQVAIDAISARLQGCNPMELDFIRLAHEKGLGVGDPKEIELVGYDISLEEAWNFTLADTPASTCQKLIAHGPLRRSPISGAASFASSLYHKVYWYPFVGRKRVQKALETRWGKLFKSYDDGKVALSKPDPKATAITVAAIVVLVSLFIMLLGRLFRR